MVIVTKKIIIVGGSRGVIFDKDLMEKLDINLGDHVEINIKKVDFKEE